MNRYDDITVSGYTPQTMQELAFVPMMKRQQEDKLVADNELIRAGLLKVDPLKEHYAEAIQLKKDIESQIDATSSELAKHGVNRDMIGKTIALNRKYQDLVSPTGRIGQINAAKAIEAQTKKEFMDNPALKDYGLDAKQRAWEKHRALYTGYDTPEKTNITNISSLSGPKYEDMQKDFTDLASKLGEKTITDLKNSGAHFEQGPFGGLIMVTGEGKVITTQNDENLKALADVMSAKYVDPKGGGYKSREFAGYDVKNTIDQLNGMLGVPKVYKQVADTNNNYNFIGDPNAKDPSEKEPTTPDATYDNTSTINLEKNIQDVDFSGIGKNKGTSVSGSMAQSHEGKKFGNSNYVEKTGIQSYKDVLTSPLHQKLYEISYNRLVKNGKIKKGSNMSDNKVAQIVGFYMKNHLKFPTIGNDIIRPDTSPDSQLFMGELSKKDAAQRNLTLEQDVRGDEESPAFRQMVDEKTGEKVKLGDGEKIDYIGYDSPINFRAHKFNNSLEQNVMAHRAQIIDKDGNFVRNVAIGRTKNEIATPEFKVMYSINHIYRNAVNNLGEWVTPTGKGTGSKQIKNYQIKYTDDGMFIIKHKGHPESKPMNPNTFQLNMRQILSE